jgi:1,2-phenylacetyl-CoA epoxidase catalytic subunit
MSDNVSDIVLSLADCKQLLGFRYAEWCSATPTLEADIAAAAMGLDDLGHSRVLAGCLSELGPDPRGPERESDPAAYRNVAFLDETWTDWSQFVAANAILDTAFTVMIESLVEGEVEVLRTRLRKMLAEEHYHFLHGRSWLRELGPTPAVGQAWQEAVEWFGPDGDELRGRLAEKLEQPEPKLEVDWSKWDPIRRRTHPGAIDRHTFDMLRGLEEKRYGIVKDASPARG